MHCKTPVSGRASTTAQAQTSCSTRLRVVGLNPLLGAERAGSPSAADTKVCEVTQVTQGRPTRCRDLATSSRTPSPHLPPSPAPSAPRLLRPHRRQGLLAGPLVPRPPPPGRPGAGSGRGSAAEGDRCGSRGIARSRAPLTRRQTPDPGLPCARQPATAMRTGLCPNSGGAGTSCLGRRSGRCTGRRGRSNRERGDCCCQGLENGVLIEERDCPGRTSTTRVSVVSSFPVPICTLSRALR
jgi:hypothetical protein